MSASIERAKRENKASTFTLQLTSMVDLFTILLVFLLKSYNTSAVDLIPSDKLTLPTSNASKEPVEALKLTVNTDGIFVADEEVVLFKNGRLPASTLDKKDRKFIRPLYKALNAEAEKSKEIAKSNETVEFDGKLVFQADRALSYGIMKKIMYTSSIAGYGDVKFAVLQK